MATETTDSKYEELKGQVLEALRGADIGLGTQDVARRLNISKTTAYRYLEMMRVEGAVESKVVGRSTVWVPKLRPYLEVQAVRRLSEGVPLKEMLSVREDGTLEVAGRRVFLSLADAIRALREAVVESVGPDEAPRVLYRYGEIQGEVYGRYAADLFRGDADSLRTVLLRVVPAAGGVKPVEFKVDEAARTLRVEVVNSMEARFFPGPEPQCHITRGFCAGAAAVFFGRRAAARELECQAQGKPRCVIEARW